MNIETKHLIALLLLATAGSTGFFLTLMSQRVRDAALFFFVFGSVFVERMDVTFAGQFWYRGTARGYEVSLLDVIPLCLLIATWLLPRYPRGRFYWPASFGMLLLYFFYCWWSVTHAYPQRYGAWELSKIFRSLVVFFAAALFIRSRREVGVLVAALGCAACLEGLNGFEQRFLKGTWRPQGTLDHENTLSTYLCMIGPVLLAAVLSNWSKWLRWLAGLGCLLGAGAELLTLSRLGVPVFALVMLATAVACTSWKITRRKLAILTICAGAIAVFLVYSWDGLKARYEQSNIQAEFTDTHAFETRGVYWRIALLMVEDHPYGVGLNNWSYYVGKSYGPELGYPYNDYDDIKWTPERDYARQILLPPAADSLPALTLGELGYAGIIVLSLVWLRWFQMGAMFLRHRLNPDPMHRLGIGLLFGAVGIFLQSATEWTYRQTPVLFTCHAMMGALAGLYCARRHPVAVRQPEAAEPEIEIEVLPAPARFAK